MLHRPPPHALAAPHSAAHSQTNILIEGDKDSFKRWALKVIDMQNKVNFLKTWYSTISWPACKSEFVK